MITKAVHANLEEYLKIKSMQGIEYLAYNKDIESHKRLFLFP